MCVCVYKYEQENPAAESSGFLISCIALISSLEFYRMNLITPTRRKGDYTLTETQSKPNSVLTDHPGTAEPSSHPSANVN